MFNQILMALKFGAASEFALVKGIELARAHDAELHIFHALDFTLNELDEDDPKRVKMVEDAHQQYDAKIKPLLADFEKGLFICLPADPAMKTCKMARELNVDLIILGCHQLPEKMCLGRVDYIGMTILEKAPCPVMLVPLCE
ncbi:MAG: universal stress protein [Desulfobacterales bacterium]|jgi:nucleotide-binding universal stress UspA family protein|nr:universal stress protein [Desulfobacterales bacterium]